ncbi:MAG TPA: DegT/DnrJ/EryC1/StrS family aminotransferase [Candidatus Binatia bacterium]|nr:DegT/DnrJ/EryC1/StrS family aminotransferase [Candidatus Binatia bacterium]
MIDPATGIESWFRGRYGREAMYLPSGRLALYLAFREWLRPGDRLLLSPVNDDVVFFTVLAAGLVPVLGPIDPRTGNLDPSSLDDQAWSRLQAVMTTNLYGLPDRMDLLEERCRRHGLLLIEDACQALDSRSGDRRIGQISTVSAFSLTKHVSGVGGVLCFSEKGRGASLARRAQAEIRRRTPGESLRDGVRLRLRDGADRLGMRPALSALLRGMRSSEPERQGHRMPCDPSRVLEAREGGGGLDRFHRWVRVDNADYRTQPLSREVRGTLRELQRFESNRARRLEGAGRLLALGLTPSSVRLPADAALFRVPLFVRDRERVLEHFAAHGLHLDYIYDPPLDVYAAETLAERLPSPGAALAWSRDVLPVDPLRAGRFLSILKTSPGILRAAS